MDITYSYTKVRKNYGRQPMFCETPSVLLDSIAPNKAEHKMYIMRNPVHKESQYYVPKFEHYINTPRVILEDRGINHAEGGWPKDVNANDEEATTRFRRRVERDDNYVDAVLGRNATFEHFIKQNNAVELYQMYFTSMKESQPVEKSTIKVANVYRDPDGRPVSSIAWTPEEDTKIVVSYCNRKYPILGSVNKNYSCYMWDIENPNDPYLEFHGPTATWQIICNPVQPSVFIGGLYDGRVCLFDIRAKREPIAFSPAHLAHRDPVSAVVFLATRLNTEFFSGSTDGLCMFWDIRNISEPTEQLIMAVKIPPGEHISLAHAEPVSALQFDKSFPTRFLCGTDTGLVINVNRKGKSHQEMMSSVFRAHRGPVNSVYRSPCTSKMYITCGDWTVHLWSEDVTTSPIVTGIPNRYPINDVAFAPQRVSAYMCVTGNGKFQYWDLLRRYREPSYILPITNVPLLKLKPHDEGRFVALGDIRGHVHLLALSENLVNPGDKDKVLMGQSYERESKREHILEARIKEIRLKQQADAPVIVKDVDIDALIKAAEDEYKRTVTDEIRRTGYTPGTGAKAPAAKKR